MADEFNPTKKDLLMVEGLILDIKSRKNDLVKRKMIIQNSLSNPGEKYQNSKKKLKECLANIELDISKVNDELTFKNKLKEEIKFYLANNKYPETKADLDKISLKVSELKKKYSSFTKDRTRIASLRVMAAEFVEELEQLLK